jgi:hypothetical protein
MPVVTRIVLGLALVLAALAPAVIDGTEPPSDPNQPCLDGDPVGIDLMWPSCANRVTNLL